MPFQQDDIQIQLQAKLFDFALTDLVRQHRETFEPLWTVDSWVKFLIWMSLNLGLSGEKKSLELFAQALGPALTTRMRKIFFERTLDDLSIRLLADPAESKVLIMPTHQEVILTNETVQQALKQVDLSSRVVQSHKCWQALDLLVAIPWEIVDK